MVSDRVKTRPSAAAPSLQLIAAIFALAASIDASPAWAQAPEQGGNPVNSVLGFFGMQPDKSKEEIDYRARAPLVVPPRFDLPKPKEVAHGADWPNDPDISERRHAAAAAQRPAPQARGETASQEEGGRAEAPGAGGTPDDCQPGALCINAPWKILQNMVGGVTGAKPETDTVATGEEPPRNYLTEPPSGYRKPLEDATATAEPAKETPDPANTKAYVGPQPH
ncbi:conserved exported protein of unknown function [Methylocella tundrae]|uniref:Uncharacterized protein n=1 Tax=Methylocella tundrae TaxID=227605 RepID=A0A4U8Z5P1_METTU|nr:hypothetical protein [Methylocella tundrae]VFU10840.1 conserved exported protein of unknown function [Methylocella tundrae]